jgi:hypothetical protein
MVINMTLNKPLRKDILLLVGTFDMVQTSTGNGLKRGDCHEITEIDIHDAFDRPAVFTGPGVDIDNGRIGGKL